MDGHYLEGTTILEEIEYLVLGHIALERELILQVERVLEKKIEKRSLRRILLVLDSMLLSQNSHLILLLDMDLEVHLGIEYQSRIHLDLVTILLKGILQRILLLEDCSFPDVQIQLLLEVEILQDLVLTIKMLT